MSDLPFIPSDATVDELPGRLDQIDDIEALNALQRADTRTTAAAHYERRISAIMRERSDLTPEDLERGYRVTEWAGYPNYEAIDGSMSSLDEEQVKEHVRRKGLARPASE